MYFADQLIIQNFDQFLDYLQANAPLSLTKRLKQLTSADLLSLNSKMSAPVMMEKDRPIQKDFFHLNLFFHIGLVAELFTIRSNGKGHELVVQPERLQLYLSLNVDERYGFLLQSCWCYLDWQTAFDQRPSFEFKNLLETLVQEADQKEFSFESPEKLMTLSKIEAELLSAFDFFEYTIINNSRWNNNFYIAIATLTLTENGRKILPLLHRERPIHLWQGQDTRMTKAKLELLYGPLDPEEEPPLELMDFFEVFKPAFPEWTVTKRLYPIQQATIAGELLIKVQLEPKCYRVIRISAAASLDDLHLAIQHVFDFGNDHLYAFFLNAKTNYTAGNVYADPRGTITEPDYPADLVSLREIGLYPGKELLYLFDFGDNWQFWVQILAIQDTTEITPDITFKLIETKGEAPDQYPNWEN